MRVFHVSGETCAEKRVGLKNKQAFPEKANEAETFQVQKMKAQGAKLQRGVMLFSF